MRSVVTAGSRLRRHHARAVTAGSRWRPWSRSLWLLVLAASGCRGILGIDEPRIFDAAIDAPVLCDAWQPRIAALCTLEAPLDALRLGAGAYLYDTTVMGGRLTPNPPDARPPIAESMLTVRQSDQSEVAVLSVAAFALDAGATITIRGVKPLVIVSWSTMSIDGMLDAGSHRAVPARVGAGANVACGELADPDDINDANGASGANAPASGGAGGGGGGAHRGLGGNGGRGGTGATGGMGGTVVSAPVVRGGCLGGSSGAAGPAATAPASPSSRAAGGSGGGAIGLVARTSITIAGAVSASGAGGAGAPFRSACGGGGGGSGGYIGLDAPIVTISGALAANGGGGGGGGGASSAGTDGGDGRLDQQPASGGPASSDNCGRPGGIGSGATLFDGATGDALAGQCAGVGGGGGGGGASGFIFVASPAFTTTPTAAISPPVQRQ